MSHTPAQAGGPQELGRFTFSTDEIIRFASQYDPQPFHTDPAAGDQALFGMLIASGWQVVMVWMRFFVDAHAVPVEPVDPRTLVPVGLGIGIDKLRWHAPARLDDTLVFETEVLQSRASSSRPGWAVVQRIGSARREDGTRVMSFEMTHLAPDFTLPAPQTAPAEAG
ncbi:MaoC/PaaZ C-terminal domain-containing protein [Xanthobacter sp. TB0139]|uniref:MaoC/PaaZ C-terminal domain-containing protein n=1 Tax=Xanthobacter sp. TB0139 TaxID=3459178 RepID=UPI0040391C56